MDPLQLIEKYPKLSKALATTLRKFPSLERALRSIPIVKAQVEKEQNQALEDLDHMLKPYKGIFETHETLPTQGRSRPSIIKEVERMKKMEEDRWKSGYVSGAVYHGEKDHIDFLNRIYALQSQTNPLHFDIWPSINKFESEIIAMTASIFGAQSVPLPERVCGSISSGGTESIMLAMKSYRDFARATRGIRKPELIAPVTAHAAFDKASQYFNIKLVQIPVDENFRADMGALRKAINRNTIVIVGSAGTFPHGVIDPIEEMSNLAKERGIGFHTDACLGGFVLPFAKKLGYEVPAFDFSLPGVTSMSADTHKFGYAAKGTSVVLYRNEEIRQHQYYVTTEWPGGMYFSPTFAGSRPGGLIAACWAAMVSMGEAGYLKAAKKILTTTDYLKSEIRKIPEIDVLDHPLFIIALRSEKLDIYRVMDFMTKRKWNLNGLHKPPFVHLCVTLRHTDAKVAKRFIVDLKAAVKHTLANPTESGGLAPVYGMAASLPVRSIIGDILRKYLDRLYRP